MEIVDTLAQEFGLKTEYSQNIINLLDEGCTIPFIARYRKEMHGTCDDQTLRAFADRLKYLRNLNEEKAKVERAITEQGSIKEGFGPLFAFRKTGQNLTHFFCTIEAWKFNRTADAKRG